jgi:hypothetical protein
MRGALPSKAHSSKGVFGDSTRGGGDKNAAAALTSEELEELAADLDFLVVSHGHAGGCALPGEPGDGRASRAATTAPAGRRRTRTPTAPARPNRARHRRARRRKLAARASALSSVPSGCGFDLEASFRRDDTLAAAAALQPHQDRQWTNKAARATLSDSNKKTRAIRLPTLVPALAWGQSAAQAASSCRSSVTSSALILRASHR